MPSREAAHIRQADDPGLFPAPQFGQVIIVFFLGSELLWTLPRVIPAAHYTQSVF